jgi:hypothetical protein
VHLKTKRVPLPLSARVATSRIPSTDTTTLHTDSLTLVPAATVRHLRGEIWHLLMAAQQLSVLASRLPVLELY